jgi:hypothetical protein
MVGTRSARIRALRPLCPPYASAVSRRQAPRAMSEISRPSKRRARGMPGAQCTRSLVRAGVVKYAHQYSQRRHRKHPAFPTQWFYGLYVISPVTSSFLPPSPHRLNGAIRIPVGPNAPPRGLASATDARTTRLRRTHQCRSSCTPLLIAHEFGSPCDLRRARHRRVHRIPRSTFVTIAIRPSSEAGWWGTGFSFRTGYKVMRCFRMRYLQPSPGSRSSSITIDRPDHQASHRARRRQGVAWTRRSLPRHRSAGQP